LVRRIEGESRDGLAAFKSGNGHTWSSRVMRILNMNRSVLVYVAYRFKLSSEAGTVQIGGGFMYPGNSGQDGKA